MALFKKKRSEKSMVYEVLQDTMLEEQASWLTTYQSLKENCRELGHESD